MMKSTMRSLAAAIALLLAPSHSFAQASPSPYTTGARYDAVGRVVGTIASDPDGAGPLKYAAVRNTYDTAGRLTKVEQGELSVWKSEAVEPSAWGTDFSVFKMVDTVHDALDRKVKESVGAGGATHAVTQYSYDLGGQLKCTAVRMDPAQWGSQTDACVPQLTGPNGPDRVTRNLYDAAGQLIQVREGVGTSVEAAEATYSYSLNGKREYVIDANGNRAQLTYDGHDRQEKWIFPSTTRPTAYNGATQVTALSSAGAVNAADYEQYGYDANGNRTSLRKRDGSTLTYSYDALNRMTVKVVPSRANLTAAQTRDVYYDYDLRGLMLKARFDSLSGDGITSAYDGFGALTSSTISMAGLSRTLTYQVDPEGNRTRITHPDGAYFTMGYDGLDRMANASWTIGGGTTPFMSIAFENSGRRSNISRASSWTAYGYDPIGRLAWMPQDFVGTANDVTQTFSHNPASQMVSEARDNDQYAWTGSVVVNRTYTTNGLNQYTAAGPAAFTYDANGNLTSDGSTSFVYDIENRLVSASGAKTANLVYDPMGRLFETSGGTSGVTRFLYDGDKLALEYDELGTIKWRYFFGPNVDEPILADPGGTLACSNGTRFLHGNHQGSIIALADCWGARQAVNSYDEYGIPATANQGRFQYTGQAWLPELGMYYYKARLYSPTLGRFLQVDPIGYDDQVNLYAYVGNDPANKVDPTGKCEMLQLCPPPPPKSLTGGPLLPPLKPSAPTVSSGQTQSAESKKLSAGSQVVGTFGAAQGALAKASDLSAKGNGGVGVTALKGFGVAGTVAGAALDAKSQIADGKAPDAAVANAGVRALGVTLIGIGFAAATETGGLSIVAGVGGSLLVDAVAGEKIGNSAEQGYLAIKNSINKPEESGGGW